MGYPRGFFGVYRPSGPPSCWFKVRIKKWFLEKNGAYSEDGKNGKNESSWWFVDKKTENAYHLWRKQKYLWKGGWVPKSCVIETAPSERNCCSYEGLDNK